MLYLLAMENDFSYYFSEGEIRSFLQIPKTKGRSALGSALFFMFIGLVLVVLSFFVINFDAFVRLSNLSVVAANPVASSSNSSAATTSSQNNQNNSSISVNQIPKPTPNPTPEPDFSLPNDTVMVNSLGISAPVSWDIPLNESDIQAKLVQGVVHILGTAQPGEHGTVVIFGHSSNYIWAKGSYNSVFAPLIKAQPGQQITLVFQHVPYTYKIVKTFTVSPSDIAVFNASSQDSLRLITCTPIGTSFNRLVIEADQISPNTSLNLPFTTATFIGNIPATR
jgi:sortase A